MYLCTKLSLSPISLCVCVSSWPGHAVYAGSSATALSSFYCLYASESICQGLEDDWRALELQGPPELVKWKDLKLYDRGKKVHFTCLICLSIHPNRSPNFHTTFTPSHQPFLYVPSYCNASSGYYKGLITRALCKHAGLPPAQWRSKEIGVEIRWKSCDPGASLCILCEDDRVGRDCQVDKAIFSCKGPSWCSVSDLTG